jgi:hypothetical protein
MRSNVIGGGACFVLHAPAAFFALSADGRALDIEASRSRLLN